MRSTAIILAGAALAVALPATIQDAIQQIPSCSYTAFGQALVAVECTTGSISSDTLSCMCENLGPLAASVPTYLSDITCVKDWATAFGTACGVYDLNKADSSQVSAGVAALASEVGGSVASSAPSSVTASATSAALPSDSAAAIISSAVAANSIASSVATSSGSLAVASSAASISGLSSTRIAPLPSAQTATPTGASSSSSTGGAPMATAGALLAPVIAVAAVLL